MENDIKDDTPKSPYENFIGRAGDLGKGICERKYLFEYDDGNKETFDQMVERVCNSNDEIKSLFLNRQFIYGGRIISNRGLHKLGRKITYSNCYVLAQPEDNIESIYDTCAKLARTFSYGGGVGIDISNLSPNGSRIRNAAKRTTGAVSFMETFSEVSQTIGQNGRRKSTK